MPASLLKEAVDAENELRRKFAQERSHPDLSDPYVGLMPVHWCEDLLTCRELSPEEAALPKVFPLASRRRGAAVVSRAEFEENFEIFTEGLLRGLNWDNVFAAGGSVLAALLPVPQEHRATRQGKRRYFHHEAYTASDVDLFFYGLDEAQGNEKLKEVYYAICDSFPDPSVQPLCFRTEHAVTIVSKFPYRHVQVVLRLYKSPAEVLAGFDVDSCSVGYDGSNVWMTPRCHNSVTAQYNTVDMTRRSPTYEVRLAKYAARGVEVAVPMLDRDAVDPQIYETPFEKTKGLTKLLLLEKLSTPAQRLQYKQQQRVGRLQPLVVRQGRFYNRLQEDMKDAFLQAQIDASPGDVSDYQTVFLPWGPNWDANKVRNLVYTKDMLLNSTFVDPFRKGHRHPCFFGTAAEVLEDCSGQDGRLGGAGAGASRKKKDEEAEEEVKESNTVSGKLTWMTVDPGQQSIGSFHPITAGEWAEGVHLSQATGRLVEISQDLALSLDAAAAAVAAISPAVDSSTINMRDAAGRTPLMLAVLAGNAAAVKAFIARGALLNARLQDGRTALHLAAQYGRLAAVGPLLERGRSLNAALGEHLLKMEQEERALAQQQVDEETSLEKMKEEEGSQAFFRALHVLRRKRAQEAAKRSAEREEQGYLDKLDIDGVDYDQRMTPLMYAAFFGHGKVAAALLDAQADPNKMLVYEQNGMASAKYAVLTLACHNGHSGVFRLLLERGASARAEAMDMRQCTPLHYAALWGELDCARLLLEPREEWGAPDDAVEPAPMCGFLCRGSKKKSEEVQGAAPAADPDAVDVNQSTALELAVSEGHVQVVELLLKHTGKLGALGSAAAKAQKSLVACAVRLLQAEVLRALLRSKGDASAMSWTQHGHSGGFGGGGLFSGGGGFGGGFHSNSFGGWYGWQRDQTTVLDWARFELKDVEADLLRLKSGDTQPEPLPQHVKVGDYFDFLLSRTPSGFERFALGELKRQAEVNAKAKDSVTQTRGGFNPDVIAKNIAAAEEKVSKLGSVIEVLEEFGAKTYSDLQAANAAAAGGGRSKSAPAARKKQAKGRNTGGKRARSPQAAGSAAGSPAFQLGVGEMGAVQAWFKEQFEPIATPTGGPDGLHSLDQEVNGQGMQPRYKALFDAVVASDVSKVKALCEPAPATAGTASSAGASSDASSPLLVAVRSSMLQRSLLDVAVLQDSAEMVRCLLQIAARQYTPEPSEEEAAPDEEVLFKDAQLVQMGAQEGTFSEFAQSSQHQLQQLKEAQSFKRKGHKMLERLEKYKAESRGAEGADEERLVSVCSVFKLINGNGGGALHLAVQRRCYAAAEALLEAVGALDLLAEPGEEELVQQQIGVPAGSGFGFGPGGAGGGGLFAGGGAGGGGLFAGGGGGHFGSPAPSPDRPPPTLKALLLRARAPFGGPGGTSELAGMQLTAFEAAIAGDDVRMAELLLGQGAQDCLRSEAGQELQALYTGLEVAGEKREDWALPRRLVLSRAAVRRERLRGLHVAAAAGAERSIEFLLDGGLDTFAIVGDAEEEGVAKEELVSCSLFSLEDRDAQGQTPLHYAIRHGQTSALRKLLSAGGGAPQGLLAKVLNDRGAEPKFFPLALHLAISLAKADCVGLLVGHKASMLIEDLRSHQAALHVAATLAESGEEPRKAKTAVLGALLDAAVKEDCLLKMLLLDECGGTALHKAVEHQSWLTIEALLERMRRLGDKDRKSVLEAKNKSGLTALHLAVQHTGPLRQQIVSALLAAGADAAAPDSGGSTALHLAARAGADAELLRVLLPAAAVEGRDAVGVEDAAGRTPLEWLMASQLSSLAQSGSAKKSGALDSLALLARAEAAGRRVVDPTMVRQQASAVATAAAASAPSRAATVGPYRAGDRVCGLYHGRTWYKATIEKENDDGTFTLLWDDGDENDRVKRVDQLKWLQAHAEDEDEDEGSDDSS